MKKINLNQLSMSWNEKQKPRRIGQYAAILIMLLTLGVGQMWAMDVKKPKVYFNNQTPNWSTSNFYFAVGHSSYTRLYYTTTISNTKLQYVNLGNYDCSYCSCDCQQWGDATYVAFCRTTSAWDQAGSYGYSNIQKAQKYSGQKNSYNMNSGNTYYCYMANANNGATLSVDYKSSGYSGIPTFNATQSAKKRDTGTSYSTVSGSWPATLKLKGTYLSGDGASTQSTITSTASTDEDAKKVYGAVVTGSITHSYESLSSSYYFEGWGTGSTPSETGSTCTYNITADRTTYAFFSKKYTLSYDRKGTYGTSTLGTPTIANFSGTKTSGSSIPTGHSISFTASPATGYEVEGWYSDAACSSAYTNGTGGVTISGSGNVNFTLASLDANSGVYCKFRKKTYSITLDDNGDYQGNGSATVQRGDASLTVASHASRTSWNLVGYWTASGVGGTQVADAEGVLLTSVSGYTDGSGTWIYDGNVSLYAHWSQTYSLTVSAGSNISSVTGSNADVTLNSKYAISATPNTGYSFSSWTASPSDNGVFDDASAASTNVTVKNGSVTVTGAATENLTAVTVNVSPAGAGTLTKGGSAFTPGNSVSVGVTTGYSMVATPNSGYVFHDWTKTGNAAGTPSTNTFPLKGNGSAGTGTLTANFGIASGWYMIGDDFGGWGTSPYPTSDQLTYPYRGMSGVYYIPVASLPTNKYWRVRTGSTQYNTSSSTTDNNTISKGTIYSLSTNTSKASKPSSALSDVWIVVNTGSSKKLWVQDPQTFHNVNVTNEGSGSKGTYKVTLNTTSAFTRGANVFETTQFANGETFTVTVTGKSGYIPTITIGGTEHTFWQEAATYSADGTMSTSDIAVSISYTASRAVRFAKTTGCKTLTATGPSSTSVSDNTKIKDGTTITFHQENNTGYTFSKWYSNNTGTSGTEYSTDDDDFELTVSSTRYTIYPIYTENMTTVNLVASPTGKGTFTSGEAVSSVSAGVATKPTVTAVPGTGYHLTGTIWSESSDYISLSATNTAATTITATGETGKTVDLTATFTPNTYTVRFHRNGGAGDVVNQDFTYDAAQNLTANSYTRTGYTFAGWALTTDGAVTYTDGAEVSNLTSENGATFHLYAKWNAKQCTINFDFDATDPGHGSHTSATTSTTATYAAAMTSVTPPTAANGWAFMGYFDAADGEGTQYYTSTGASARTWDKNTVSPTTLYAYYKKAEITNLVAAPGVIAPGETITVTPTIDPTPTGTTIVCYELQYSNGTPLPSQPSFDYDGNAVTFPVPSASATYIIQAKLAKGSTCPADPGDVLSTRTTTFQVAGEHDVTVKYMCGDLTIKASEVLGEIRPLTWSDDITAPTITGYTFARWDAGDGVTIKDGSGEDKTTSTSSTIKIKAVYDGTLTAVYTKKRLIFFNNTLGWSNVYVYFYKNGSYWDKDKGTGANTYDTYTDTPYSEGLHGEMTQIEGTNIFYFDAEAAGVNASYINVAFTELDQHGYHYFAKTGDVKNKVIRRGDYSTTLPMFVPLEGIEPTEMNSNLADYYNKGYWMNYPENTGYTLHIYDSKTYGSGSSMQVIPFEFNGDKTMPMTVKVELNANREYGYEIHRADGNVYGNDSKVLKINDSGEEDPEGLTASQRGGIQTSVAGDYEFTLNYGEKGVDTYKYLIGVHYPVAANDYRIVYTDEATWSKAAHTSGWYHPSRAIHKEEGSKDIVSFYVSKAGGANAGMKFQYASAIEPSTGVVTWTDVPSGTIDLSGITESGVYNFHLTQDASSISVEKIEPYTGNYYIRTDCAGNSKWENFRTLDHQMTYSDYAEEHSGYSHYYAHWVTIGTNVKFCIANDYSQCITDTLTQDYGTVIANIDAAGALNSASANIRFMWNQATNKISRAYIGGSTNISDRFLVLEGDSKMYDKDGSALSISGLNPNEANLIDDQNFVYEREIQVNTKARAKLTAKYNNNIQYFKGSEGAFAEGTTIELLGGNASGKHSMRIVYDFKTNRLVTAYVPSGTIEDDIAINADLMIVREHQGAGQQLLFEGDGALSEVHTVYGVMRFNRWTLNNKEKTGSHDPVGDPKSAYERGLYWISFPFDVNLSDVFGFGTYGTHWIIMEYDGAERAQKGYWADSEGFWKYVMPSQRATYELKAGKGYVLALDLDLMKDNNSSFWSNNIEQVELFFPSAKEVEDISSTNVTTTVEEHECTIDRTEPKGGADINKNRTKADSHWNMIGIPSYANYGDVLKNGEGGATITWNSNPSTQDLPFLYEWNAVDNTYTVHSGTTYPFKAMHAYMVQYHGDLYWSLASATPTSPIVARRTYAEEPQNVEFRLELQQNDKMIDQTFVKLSNDEKTSGNFIFDEDLCKEYNGTKANIYTFIEGYIPAAGNTLPMSEQTTVIPVGVQIKTDGEYTFAMPAGTDGVGVTLIDNVTNTRTNLGLTDYTVTLSSGTIDGRFVLEISPIAETPTNIEAISDQNSAVRKVMIDGILYIVKGNRIYDATGALVK